MFIPKEIDWRRFARIVAFHRIGGFSGAWLADRSDVPGDVRAAGSEAAERVVGKNLKIAAECQRLLEAFNKSGTSLLFLKGLPVAALAYRNPMLKVAIDIDLLVDPGDLSRAALILKDHGYRLVVPSESDVRALRAWHDHSKESVWISDAGQVQLDLHTRTADNALLIPRISIHSPRQDVDIGNRIGLPTLAFDELCAYLAVHGASSAWFRLKWASDFAGILEDCSPVEIQDLFESSQQLGAGRAAAQALLVADRLFGTLRTSEGLRRRLLADRATRRLCALALRLLAREPTEPTERFLGTLPLRMSQFLILPDIRFKLTEFAMQARRLSNRLG